MGGCSGNIWWEKEFLQDAYYRTSEIRQALDVKISIALELKQHNLSVSAIPVGSTTSVFVAQLDYPRKTYQADVSAKVISFKYPNNFIIVSFNNVRLHAPSETIGDLKNILLSDSKYYHKNFQRKGLLTSVYDNLETICHNDRPFLVVPSLCQPTSASRDFWLKRIISKLPNFGPDLANQFLDALDPWRIWRNRNGV